MTREQDSRPGEPPSGLAGKRPARGASPVRPAWTSGSRIPPASLVLRVYWAVMCFFIAILVVGFGVDLGRLLLNAVVPGWQLGDPFDKAMPLDGRIFAAMLIAAVLGSAGGWIYAASLTRLLFAGVGILRIGVLLVLVLGGLLLAWDWLWSG